MPKTLVGTPDPDQPEDKAAAFLAEMATKTDVELVAAYIELSQGGLPWIHPAHVIRLLKLAASSMGD